jgi:hypothetical protein
MKHASVAMALAVLAAWPLTGRAGMLVKVTDPRYFQTPQPVLFPNAEIKLVMLEFDAKVGNQSGKQRARELHDAYLARIQNLPGSAVVTYVTDEGQRISNFRVEATEVAGRQGAVMALWGRVLVDHQGRSRTAARLTIVVPPPGVEARYLDSEVQGVIAAPVAPASIDFAPMEGNVSVLAPFVSGLARYYKGATRQGSEAAKWLSQCVSEFREFVARVPESADAAALAQAHLYIARALVRLAEAAPVQKKAHLEAAEKHAADAARLNPYDPAIPPVQAVIAQQGAAPRSVVRARLAESVRLAPSNSAARLNLAVFDASIGQAGTAMKSIEQAKKFQKILGRPEPMEQQQVEADLRHVR